MPSPGPSLRQPPRGSAALSVVLLFFLISCLGLGLVLFAAGSLRMAQARRDALCLESAAEAGVKRALAGLVAWEASSPSEPEALSEEAEAALRADAAAGGILAAEEAMGISLPINSEGALDALSWTASAACYPERRRETDTRLQADFLLSIDAIGRMTGRPPEAAAGLDLGLRVLAGRPPLAYFPLLLAGPEANEAAAALLEDGRLSLAPGRVRSLAPRGRVTPRPLIPRDASPLMAEALKARFLEPGSIRLDLLRQALGLPAVDEPVPDGVYLVRSEAGPGGVFVQGDLEALLLAVDGDRQVIGFESSSGSWRLSFRPGLGPLEFTTPQGSVQDPQPPLGIILVNGLIGSLTTAEAESDGSLTPAPSSGLPCLRDGLALTIVSSRETVIGSDLLHEGVRWAESIPYLRDRQSQLVVYSSGRDLATGAETEAGITIGAQAPSCVRIQASLSTAGGFSVAGGAKNVIVSGGIQAGSVRPGASRVTIAPDDRLTEGLLAPAPGPAAAESVLIVLSLAPRAWREGR